MEKRDVSVRYLLNNVGSTSNYSSQCAIDILRESPDFSQRCSWPDYVANSIDPTPDIALTYLRAPPRRRANRGKTR